MTEDKKKLIAETPITMDCFEMGDFEGITFNYERITNEDFDFWTFFRCHLETLRQTYNETKDEKYLKEFIRLLPNSYKVVKL